MTRGDKLRDARTRSHLSLQDVADRLGWSRQRVWDLEQDRPARLETLYEVAIALDIPPNHLDARLTSSLKPVT